MDPAGQFVRKNVRDHPVAVETRSALEGRRDDVDVEMGFTFGTRTGVTVMLRGLIDDRQPRRRQCRGQLPLDCRSGAHGV